MRGERSDYDRDRMDRREQSYDDRSRDRGQDMRRQQYDEYSRQIGGGYESRGGRGDDRGGWRPADGFDRGEEYGGRSGGGQQYGGSSFGNRGFGDQEYDRGRYDRGQSSDRTNQSRGGSGDMYRGSDRFGRQGDQGRYGAEEGYGGYSGYGGSSGYGGGNRSGSDYGSGGAYGGGYGAGQRRNEDESWSSNWLQSGMQDDRSSRSGAGQQQGRGRSQQGGWDDERSQSWSGDERGGGRERQTHAGKGPKGWSRSDEQLREDVNMALARDPEIDAEDCEVSVSNGEVTLSGTVADKRTKRLAEDCVENVFGVKDVQNQIRVKRRDASSQGSSEGGDDAQERSSQSRNKNKTGSTSTSANA